MCFWQTVLCKGENDEYCHRRRNGQTGWFANRSVDQASQRADDVEPARRFNNLSLDGREARFGDRRAPEPLVPVEPTVKFAEIVDLGIITVPDDYDHASRLGKFSKQNRKKFSYYNDAITDANFPNPTRILKPGAKLRVRAFKQIVGGTTTDPCPNFRARVFFCILIPMQKVVLVALVVSLGGFFWYQGVPVTGSPDLSAVASAPRLAVKPAVPANPGPVLRNGSWPLNMTATSTVAKS